MDTDQITEKTTQSQPQGQADVSVNATGSFFVSKGSALKVAVVGTVVWLVLLEIFFMGIWPSL